MISSIFPARQQVLPESGPERSSGRRSRVSVALIGILALAATWLVWRALRGREFDWRLAAFSLAHVRPGWLLLSIAGIYATYWGRALRWAVFLRPLKADPSVANLLAATVIGFTVITLLGRPGEIVRPYLIAVKERVPLASQFAAWLLERVADLLMVLILFGFALGRVGLQTTAARPGLHWLLSKGGIFVALAAGGLLILLVFLRHLTAPAQRLLDRSFKFLPEKTFIALMRLAETFLRGVESTRSDAALFRVLVYSVLEWLLIIASYWCLTASFPELNLTFQDVLVFIGFVALGASVQIPGIGGGIQVTAVVVLTELFGVRLEEATVFAFLIWLVTFVAVVPVGLVLSVREGLKWDKLRRLRLHNS
jgi:glycosyltransferase 2 family protein